MKNYLKSNYLSLAIVAAALAVGAFLDPAAGAAGMAGGFGIGATRRSGGKSKKNTISVDLSEVESGGGRLPDGDYLMEVEEASIETGKDSGEDYVKFVFAVADGEYKGRKIFHNCSLQPQALFNLRGVLEALEVEIPKDGKLNIDCEELIELKCGAAIANEKYEGKDRPRAVEFFPASELEEEAPAKGDKGNKSKDEDEERGSTRRKVSKTKEPEFEEGDSVTFKDGKEEYEGTIEKIDGDVATVKVGKGRSAEKWEIDLAELTKAED